MAKNTFYITTAIDYVNGKPHIGHAFEKTIADALARWNKLEGKKVFFLTGTDENAQKNVQAAKAKKVPVKDFVNKNSKLFKDLCEKLNISYDRFIKTSEPEHAKVSQELFQKAYDSGDIYKGKYEGYYCQGCEAFKIERELVDGKCPDHNTKASWISEETYFFKLSKYKDQIIDFVKDYIVPEKRKNEILSRLQKDGLRDLSVTREKLDWGIDSPVDKNHKIYVWFDALINYYSGSEGHWPADVHVIGKDINWFHSVIWPAILLSTKNPLPKTLLVHGFLNLRGSKMSKSKGNVIDPIKLIKKYGSDSVRYSLLRCNLLEDSDYSEELLIERHNGELANKLGNLVSRISALAEKYGTEEVSLEHIDEHIHISNVIRDFKELIGRYELDKALNLVFSFVDTLNQWVQDKKVWETGSKTDLFELSTGIRVASVLLWPFIPETSEKIAKTFGFDISLDELNKPLKIIKIKKPSILFKKIKPK